MTLVNDEKPKVASATPFSCCQMEAHSSSLENSITDADDDDDNVPAETVVAINNNIQLDKCEYNFPRRIPIDIEFQDIKYTVGKFSFSQRKYGKKTRAPIVCKM